MPAKRIVLLYNPASGALIDSVLAPPSQYFEALVDRCCNGRVQLLLLEHGRIGALGKMLEHNPPDGVWVAGGDGTVLSAACVTLRAGVPLGILPAGTMNLMARDIGMSLDLEQAVRQLWDAEVELIDMAELNGKPFLCLSNIGMSTRLTERREKLRRHSGWIRWPLMAWYMAKFMFSYPALDVHLKLGNQVHSLRTRSITVCNNLLAEESSLLPIRERLNGGELGIYIAKDRSLWSLPRLIYRLLRRDWKNDRDLLMFRGEQVQISIGQRRKRVRVMTDGELRQEGLPLRYRIRPQSLKILKPRVPA